jgi:hypothetical protein
VITNHGSIAHELAYYNIPVINTGDNPHVNYKFCYHCKNIHDLKNIINNFNSYKNKIIFNKRDIYQFAYMHYYHFAFMFNSKYLFKDSYFVKQNIELNKKSILLKYFLKQNRVVHNNITEYIKKFVHSL